MLLFLFYRIQQNICIILMYTMILPRYAQALPIHQKSGLEDAISKMDILKTKLQTLTENENTQPKQLELKLSHVIKSLEHKIDLSQQIEEELGRKKRWDANLLALTLFEHGVQQDTLKSLAAKRADDVALYDPFGGGVWGRKKRSVAEFAEFDYEVEDL